MELKARYNQYLENEGLCGIGKRNKLRLSYEQFVEKQKQLK
nr:MAG TPA: hypothetical protein [Bacteriophage sp.]DAM94496.1 MAG TPA: hypothetical protein [Caudoviricetes sp.]